jgi:hypothetical protein
VHKVLKKKGNPDRVTRNDNQDGKLDFKQILVKVAFFCMLLVFALLISKMGVDKYDGNRVGNAVSVNYVQISQTAQIMLTTQMTEYPTTQTIAPAIDQRDFRK